MYICVKLRKLDFSIVQMISSKIQVIKKHVNSQMYNMIVESNQQYLATTKGSTRTQEKKMPHQRIHTLQFGLYKLS